jgi:hypothetical protein
MFNIMSLRHHWTKNFSIPALFMPRLLAITAFPGFVYVFNNSYFWLWYSRLWTCGIVFVKEYCDSLEKKFRLLKKRVVIDSSMPTELPRKGLDAMRQWYLYQEIRPLCYCNKDITCPKPTVHRTSLILNKLWYIVIIP